MIPKEVTREYVRRRAGQEWFFKDRKLDYYTLGDGIFEDFHVILTARESKQLLEEHIGMGSREELEKEFADSIKELFKKKGL